MTDLLRELEDAVVVDFESDPIRPRPQYPPEPCGVAIKLGGEPARYLAWGHRGHGNPDHLDDALSALRAAWASGRPLLFHNAKFDLAVAVERLGLPLPAWDRVHDTIPLLFLLDPRADTYSLKPSAERLLGQAPAERDAVVDWLVAQQPVAGVKLSRAPKSETYAGAYIAWAPPALVGEYCVGDVDRTRALALWAAPRLTELGMVDAYDRERRILPVVMDMERRGVRVAYDRLRADLDDAEFTLIELDAWLRHRLGAGDSVSFDSGAELAAALIACGAATCASLGVTPKSGKPQTNKEAFARGINDPQLNAALRYRGALLTTVRTFMEPWAATAEKAGGRIFTTWNSTRTSRDDGNAGARTGRFSSNPNFQNIPKEVKPLFACVAEPKLPPAPFALPPLPHVRGYILPELSHVLVGRDFASQELRVMAHYEDDVLRDAYRAQPDLDLHQHVTDTFHARGYAHLTRRKVKNLHFAVIYGVGVGHLAELLECSVSEARAILDAYYREFPSVKALSAATRVRWRSGQAVTTWGGRVYPPEPPRFVDGRLRGWEYKALNVIVQGSSADLTKEAMIAYADVAGDAPLILTVHDELVVTAPQDTWGGALQRLRDAMNVNRLDVPMRSDGYFGPNWSELTKIGEVPPPPEPEPPEDRGIYDGPNGQEHQPVKP